MADPNIAAQAAAQAAATNPEGFGMWIWTMGGALTLFMLGIIRGIISKRDKEIGDALNEIRADIKEVKSDLTALDKLVAADYPSTEKMERSHAVMMSHINDQFRIINDGICNRR